MPLTTVLHHYLGLKILPRFSLLWSRTIQKISILMLIVENADTLRSYLFRSLPIQ